MFRLELRQPQGRLTAAQGSAEGIVGHAVGKGGTAHRPKGAALEPVEPKMMAEGLNDWEWQVGPESHEWIAADQSATTEPDVDGLG